MAPRRPISWVPLLGAVVIGAILTGTISWLVTLRSVEERIKAHHASLKKLMLSGRIPPNEEVLRYLIIRPAAIEARYRYWLQRVASPQMAEAASADPQLYFQEQFHEVQRTLERLATARAMAAPEQLGFPKELPPSDTVPRLLIQLSLIKDAASLIFEQGVAQLTSLKVEDPQPVPQPEGATPFLTRLPVRVRLNASLPQLMKVLGAIQRETPLIDVLAIRIAPVTVQPAGTDAPSNGTTTADAQLPAGQPAGGTPEALEVELLLSRYLVTAQTQAPLSDVEQAAGSKGRPAKSGPTKRPPKPTNPTQRDE